MMNTFIGFALMVIGFMSYNFAARYGISRNRKYVFMQGSGEEIKKLNKNDSLAMYVGLVGFMLTAPGIMIFFNYNTIEENSWREYLFYVFNVCFNVMCIYTNIQLVKEYRNKLGNL